MCMKVEVIPGYHRGKYLVEISRGVQHFRLDYEGSKSECEWMARMFRTAQNVNGGSKVKNRRK
jgi:hypothetical protein